MSDASIISRWKSRSARESLGTVLGPATGIAGMALLGAGAVAVFVSRNTTGTAALIAAGVVLVAIAIYGGRIESFEAAGVKMQLAAVESTLRAADRAEAAGDPERAARLRAEATQLLDAARSVAARYESIRATQASSWQRTERLEDLVSSEAYSLSSTFRSPEAVRELFRSGGEGNRVLAIVMMADHPSLADPESIAAAISNSKSAFEQYQALRAAVALGSREPRPPGTAAVRDAVQQLLDSGLSSPESDRGKVARRVLELLA